MRNFLTAKQLTIKNFAMLCLWGLSFFPLAVWGYMGTFTRYLADDYSTAGMFGRYGFWRVQSYWYTSWHGNYSFAFLITLADAAGIAFTRMLPALNILLWVAALGWLLYRLLRLFGLFVEPLAAVLVANIIFFAAVRGIPAYSQIIFWQIVIFRYLAPALLGVALAAVLIGRLGRAERRALRWQEYVLWAVLAFFVGGFSESWVIMQISMGGLALVAWFFLRARKDVFGLALVIFVASWASLLVVAKAPGNMNRDTIMAEISFGLLYNSLRSAFFDVPRFLAEWLAGNTGLVGLVMLAGLAVGLASAPASKPKNNLPAGVALLLGAYIVMWAGFVPQYAVMGIRPAERVIIMPLILWITALAFLFVLLGHRLSGLAFATLRALPGRVALVCLAVMLLWLPARAAFTYLRLLPALNVYAQLWDARDLKLRQAASDGEKDVIVKSLKRNPALHELQTTFWIEGDLQDDPHNWINEAAAIYYGLDSITLR